MESLVLCHEHLASSKGCQFELPIRPISHEDIAVFAAGHHERPASKRAQAPKLSLSNKDLSQKVFTSLNGLLNWPPTRWTRVESYEKSVRTSGENIHVPQQVLGVTRYPYHCHKLLVATLSLSHLVEERWRSHRHIRDARSSHTQFLQRLTARNAPSLLHALALSDRSLWGFNSTDTDLETHRPLLTNVPTGGQHTAT